MFFAPGHIFGGTEVVGSSFHVLRSRTRFRWYRGRLVPFSCFAWPDSFFGGTVGVGSRFLDLRAQTSIRQYRGPQVPFKFLQPRTRFRRYRGRRVPFSCFMLPDSFSAVPSASGPVFMFCAPRLVFGDNEGVGPRLHVLRAQTRFRRY
jgi:hypothetical protein